MTVDERKRQSFSFAVNACTGTDREVRYVEHVVAIVSATSSSSAASRGDLELSLRSAQGTKSTLLTPRANDMSSMGLWGWRFLTVALWGENPAGDWKLSAGTASDNKIISVQLEIHGTYDRPAITKLPAFSQCHAECYDGCVGYTATECHSCKHRTRPLQNGSFLCLPRCPWGTVQKGYDCEQQRVPATTSTPFQIPWWYPTDLTLPAYLQPGHAHTASPPPELPAATGSYTTAWPGDVINDVTSDAAGDDDEDDSDYDNGSSNEQQTSQDYGGDLFNPGSTSDRHKSNKGNSGTNKVWIVAPVCVITGLVMISVLVVGIRSHLRYRNNHAVPGQRRSRVVNGYVRVHNYV